MFRGDIWDVRFPQSIGPRRCLVLTTNPLISRLGAVTVAEVTGSEGPAATHVEVGAAAGLTGRDRSWINATAIHTVAKGKLRRHRGRLSPAELRRVDEALRLYLDLE
jgi:mRNA interferase MazF